MHNEFQLAFGLLLLSILWLLLAGLTSKLVVIANLRQLPFLLVSPIPHNPEPAAADTHFLALDKLPEIPLLVVQALLALLEIATTDPETPDSCKFTVNGCRACLYCQVFHRLQGDGLGECWRRRPQVADLGSFLGLRLWVLSRGAFWRLSRTLPTGRTLFPKCTPYTLPIITTLADLMCYYYQYIDYRQC